MEFRVDAAYHQAVQLSGYANQLRSARQQLQSYKQSISANWQGKEVVYIMAAIERTISQIDSIISQLQTLGADVKNAACAIQREDDERARRQRSQTITIMSAKEY